MRTLTQGENVNDFVQLFWLMSTNVPDAPVPQHKHTHTILCVCVCVCVTAVSAPDHIRTSCLALCCNIVNMDTGRCVRDCDVFIKTH